MERVWLPKSPPVQGEQKSISTGKAFSDWDVKPPQQLQRSLLANHPEPVHRKLVLVKEYF